MLDRRLADQSCAPARQAGGGRTDVTKPLGLRDRALLETLYSTGMRCSELVALEVYDLEPDRWIITIRRGKGQKDRVVPIGQRALAWTE